MRDIEQSNLQQIEALNQRGGRTLSIVDLILANTVSLGIAAYVGEAISHGASLLTAANPGGAGKTALLAALLGFLPRNLRIVTVDDPAVVATAEREEMRHCYLAHEIGSGRWYGYIWGPLVMRYLALAAGHHTIASCLHADTFEELFEILASPPLQVSSSALLGVDFIIFMHVERAGTGGRSYRRRVAAVYESDPSAQSHRLIFRWDRTADAFEAVRRVRESAQITRFARFLEGLTNSGVRDFVTVRQSYLTFLEGADAV